MDFSIFQASILGGGGGLVFAWMHIKYLKDEIAQKNARIATLELQAIDARNQLSTLTAQSIEAVTLNNHLLSNKGD